MLFKDRQDAGKKLATLLKTNPYIKRRLTESRGVVVSLLRGGIIVGDEIAQSLKIAHLPLVVTKIPSPDNPELAIGALCFDTTYLKKDIVASLSLDEKTIIDRIRMAREKFDSYIKRFKIEKSRYDKLKDKIIILADDGIATGATSKTALLFLKQLKTKKIFLASPIAPVDFDTRGFDEDFILQKETAFSSVSQFYEDFPQIEDEEVKKILTP